MLALRRMFGVERRCPHRLPSRSFASFARTTRPSLPPRLRGGSVGLGTKTAPFLHRFRGVGSRGPQNEVFANMDGPVARFPTVPNGSRAGSVRFMHFILLIQLCSCRPRERNVCICMYLYVIIHNNKNATVAGCSALEIGANHPGSNRPVLPLKKGTYAQHGY